MADDGLKIRALKLKPKPAPEKPPLPGPASYDIVSLVPLEIGTDSGLAIAPDGSTLARLVCDFGIDPRLIREAIGREADINDEGDIVLNRHHKFNGDWFDDGAVIGSITDCQFGLEPEWVNASIGRYAKLKGVS